MIIFSYTGSPQVKISQKVLGGLLFLTHIVYVWYCTWPCTRLDGELLCQCVRRRMALYAVWTGLYTVDTLDAGSVVLDIGISYQPCHFLDICYR